MPLAVIASLILIALVVCGMMLYDIRTSLKSLHGSSPADLAAVVAELKAAHEQLRIAVDQLRLAHEATALLVEQLRISQERLAQTDYSLVAAQLAAMGIEIRELRADLDTVKESAKSILEMIR